MIENGARVKWTAGTTHRIAFLPSSGWPCSDLPHARHICGCNKVFTVLFLCGGWGDKKPPAC